MHGDNWLLFFSSIKNDYLLKGRQRENRESKQSHLVHVALLLYTETWKKETTNFLCPHGSFVSTSFNWLISIMSLSSGWGTFIYMHRESNIYSSIRQIYDITTH